MNIRKLFERWFKGIKVAPGDHKYAEREAGPSRIEKSFEETARLGAKRAKDWKQARDMGTDPTKDPRESEGDKKS